jgi:hypothetical protein
MLPVACRHTPNFYGTFASPYVADFTHFCTMVCVINSKPHMTLTLLLLLLLLPQLRPWLCIPYAAALQLSAKQVYSSANLSHNSSARLCQGLPTALAGHVLCLLLCCASCAAWPCCSSAAVLLAAGISTSESCHAQQKTHIHHQQQHCDLANSSPHS